MLVSFALALACTDPCQEGYGRDAGGNCVPLATHDDTGADDTGSDDTGDTGPDTGETGDTSDTQETGDTNETGDTQPPQTDPDPDAVLIGQNGGDLLGYALIGLPDSDGDGRDEIALAGPNHNRGAIRQGAVWLLRGRADASWSLDAADAELLGDAEEDRAGITVASAGDVDGDGAADLIVGAQHHKTTYTNDGAAYLLSGAGLSGEGSLGDVAFATLYGSSGNEFAGAAVGGAGDIDGDGLDDVLVGATQGQWGQPDIYGPGIAYLAYAPLSGEVELDVAGAVLAGDQMGDWTGYSTEGLGDVDGDGVDDFAIGSVLSENGGYDNAGRVDLFLSAPTGSASITDSDARMYGEDSGVEGQGTRAGWALSRAGDTDGDGYAEILIGAPQGSIPDDSDGGAGAAYLVAGGAAISGDMQLLSEATARLEGAAFADRFGMSVAGDLDVDGDGRRDLLIGAPHESTNAPLAGAAYLFLGPVSGAWSADDAQVTIYGDVDGGYLGWDVSGEDVDGDGLDDLLVGAPNEDGETGAFRVFLGGSLF